jgi:hypothetical protein
MTSLSISYPSIPSDLAGLSEEEFSQVSCSYAIACSKVHEAHVQALPAEVKTALCALRTGSRQAEETVKAYYFPKGCFIKDRSNARAEMVADWRRFTLGTAQLDAIDFLDLDLQEIAEWDCCDAAPQLYAETVRKPKAKPAKKAKKVIKVKRSGR